jgi:hypothetical protein
MVTLAGPENMKDMFSPSILLGQVGIPILRVGLALRRMLPPASMWLSETIRRETALPEAIRPAFTPPHADEVQ